ncbi:hypothetical protein [Aquitalea magnusonii]|jgi:hypothetical protein|uniref:hypothetical protein n=1 Tax=Aquitalea magnusonii TaxID=332411 RepID=UPI000B5C892D|nr:hypothetical protein [Aquitalea magnusonii]
MRHLKAASLLLCCIALNSGFASAAQAQAAPWYWQCSDQCEQNAAMENRPVHKEKNGNLSIWWSVNFALGGSALHSAEIMTELDCLSGLGRDKAILYFAQPNLAGGVKSFNIDNGWYVLNQQRFSAFLLKACSAYLPPAVQPAAAAVTPSR